MSPHYDVILSGQAQWTVGADLKRLERKTDLKKMGNLERVPALILDRLGKDDNEMVRLLMNRFGFDGWREGGHTDAPLTEMALVMFKENKRYR
jgi:hypothetical protein